MDGALKYAKKAPPRPNAGRWGSVSGCEERILQCPQQTLAGVLTEVLTREKKKKRQGENNAADMGEVNVEGQKAYAATMGRWTRSTVEVLGSSAFTLL